MKKVGFSFVFWGLLIGLLLAVPQPIEIIQGVESKAEKFEIHQFQFHQNTVLAVDTKLNQIRRWEMTRKTWLPGIIRLPKQSKISDLITDENNLYILESANSKISIYDLTGNLLRSIETKGAPEAQFKNASRIEVNYQGYIYVLDKGRAEILCFSNEGMLMARAQVLNPISMSIGEDQILRVLFSKDGTYRIGLYDVHLKPLETVNIRDHFFPKDDIIDISISPYNEYYSLLGKKGQIKKLDSSGVFVPRSQFGFLGNRLSIGNFHTPVQIRSFNSKGKMLLGILDAKHKVIQLFVDTEIESTDLLKKPLYTMRPFLSETKEQAFVEAIPGDSMRIYINQSVPGKGGFKKSVPQIQALDANNREIYAIYLPNLKKQGVLGFDAMTADTAKLYICDSKANAVHLFSRSDGRYLSSFGEGGKGDGKLQKPSGIALGKSGEIYVSDTENMRITLWSPHGMYMEGVDFKLKKLKPSLLRAAADTLYFLANGNSIYKIGLQQTSNPELIISLPKISSFDILYENRLGIIDGSTQSLVILYGDKKEHRYLALHPKGEFPFFGDISAIRYDINNKELMISDRKQPTHRTLRFFYSPQKAQWQKLSITETKEVELSWDPGIGINKWIVYEASETDTIYHNVTEPRLLISKPTKSISLYRIASLSDDNKVGPLSAPLEDAYSLARYHSQNMNFALAVQALNRAKTTIPDPIIDQDIADNYRLEAQYYVKQQEYERALSSLIIARHTIGDRQDLILETINLYKLMRAYGDGIRFIKGGGYSSDPVIHKQLISLYYLYNSSLMMITEALAYLAIYPGDSSVMKYLVAGYETEADYLEALRIQREIIADEDTFETHLKLAELQILAEQTDDAITQLNRMLTRFTTEPQDEIYYLFGEALSAKKQFSLASERYESAIRINPNNANYHFKLAQSLMEVRRLSDAQRHFDLAWNQNPKSIEFGFAYAAALEKSNKILEALNVLDGLSTEVPQDSTSVDFHQLYGDLLLRNDRYDDAYRELSLAIKYFPDNEAIATKYQQVIEAREAYYRDRPPLEIVDFKYDPIYPSLQEYYKTNPIGYVSIFNTRNVPIQAIRLSVQIPQITDSAFEVTIPSILANETKVVDIIAPINTAIFELCKNAELDINTYLNIHYVYDKQDRFLPSTNTLRALRIQAMNWDNRRQYACFVNPEDTNVRSFVNSKILQLFEGKTTTLPRNLQRAIQIYSFYHANGISYVSDPSSTNSGSATNDFVQYPFQTIASKIGDCDDLVILLAASLSSIGVECGFLDIQGHVILVVDSGSNADDILNSGFDISQFIYRNGKYWIPIEATVLGKQSFGKSWMSALKRYQDILESSVLPDLIEFSDARRQYPPVQYTEAIYANEYNKNTQANETYQNELESILLINQISKEEEFIATLQKYPKNLNVINQYALWCIEVNKFDTAEALWLQLLKEDPNHFSALVNLGNLYHKQHSFEAARLNYLKALGHNREIDNLYRNLCIMEYRTGNLSKAREYFNRLQDKSVLKKLDPRIYSDLVGIGE